MRVKSKYWKRFFAEEKIPRKAKIAILGYKIGKCILKKMIKEYKPGWDEKFCPKCGCYITRTVNHGAEYPERWMSDYCARCGNKVAETDNSPWYHVLDYPDYI